MNEMSPAHAEIAHVSDTALMVAACRAHETELEDAFVRDPFAARLAGERGVAILRGLPHSSVVRLGLAVRTRFVDELLLEALRQHPIATVLSIGCGLDTRPWRLDLPSHLRWIEIDFRDVLDYKDRLMFGETPRCRRERLSVDLNDPAQRSAIYRAAGSALTLMITEGLLLYLPAATVEALAAQASSQSGVCHWISHITTSAFGRVLGGGADTTEPIRHVQASDALKGEQILEVVGRNGWTSLAMRSYITDVGFVLERVRRALGGAALPRLPYPPDDPTGVHRFGHSQRWRQPRWISHSGVEPAGDSTRVMSWQIYQPALTILLLLVTAASANQGASAARRFQTLQASLQGSRERKDWNSSVASARELKEFVNGSPASLLEVARAEIHVGELADAARNLRQFARMGQSTDLLATSTEFAPVRNLADFSEIQTTLKANRTSIGLASTAFLLSDSRLLAEDLDYDPQAKQFLVTSVREKKIISIGNGVVHDFAEAPDDWPMLAIKVDSRRGLVWATEVAMQGFVFAAKSDWGRSAVLCYDLRNGKLLRRIEGPSGSALGDMTLTEDGDPIVSDGEGGGVYRVLPKNDVLERLDDGDFVSPQTPAVPPRGNRIFVPDYVRGIALLDLATKRVQWLSPENRFALNGIDGLYFDRGRLIAVQNGTSPERVVAFRLNATLTRIESEKIIERSTPTIGDPTHGVTVGDNFYYIANSGWDTVDEHGNIKPGTAPSPPRVMRVRQELPLASRARGSN